MIRDVSSRPLRVVVTGAAGGIGGAAARRMRDLGHVVIGIDRVQDDGVLGADLADPDARVDVFARADRALGGVDALVLAAGITGRGGVHDSGPADWRPVLDVDLEAPLHLMRCAAPGMMERRFGRIVAITSVHARVGEPGSLAYDVAKAGLEAGVRSAAIDLGPYGVLVNAVAPGFVRTAMSRLPDGRDETETEAFRTVYLDGGRLPVRRGASADEIAPVIAFLAGRDNTYTTGQVITVDGGLTVTF